MLQSVVRNLIPQAELKAQRAAEDRLDNLANSLTTHWEFNATNESKDFRKWLVAFNQLLSGSRDELTKEQWKSILTNKKDQYKESLEGSKKWENCWLHSKGRRTRSEKSYNSAKDNIDRSFDEPSL